MPDLKIVRPASTAEKETSTHLDTWVVTPTDVNAWKDPPFQRALRANRKIKELIEYMKKEAEADRFGACIIPGIVTLGVLSTEPKDLYLLDGCHRRSAFLASGVKRGCVDIRMLFCENMGEMGVEYSNLNQPLVRHKPDDILRGFEWLYPSLKLVRDHCRFIGYDNIRQGPNSPTLAMTQAIKVWKGSAKNTPVRESGNSSHIGQLLESDPDDRDRMIEFYSLCFEAWGGDEPYRPMWHELNLILCAWLYRQQVISVDSPKAKVTKLDKDLFRKCLMSLSANTNYIDWVRGRYNRAQDRGPAYRRIKDTFVSRCREEIGKKVTVAQPGWA
jgi:hypothetical protein